MREKERQPLPLFTKTCVPYGTTKSSFVAGAWTVKYGSTGGGGAGFATVRSKTPSSPPEIASVVQPKRGGRCKERDDAHDRHNDNHTIAYRGHEIQGHPVHERALMSRM